MKNIIRLKNLKVFAHHGCFSEEDLVGSYYLVNVWLYTDFSRAMQTDDLYDTDNYVLLNQIVREQMQIRSKLLEHVAGRILQEIRLKFSNAKKIKLQIAKLNPPVEGELEQMSVKIIEKIFA